MTPRTPYVPEPSDFWTRLSGWCCFACAAVFFLALPALVLTEF